MQLHESSSTLYIWKKKLGIGRDVQNNVLMNILKVPKNPFWGEADILDLHVSACSRVALEWIARRKNKLEKVNPFKRCTQKRENPRCRLFPKRFFGTLSILPRTLFRTSSLNRIRLNYLLLNMFIAFVFKIIVVNNTRMSRSLSVPYGSLLFKTKSTTSG